MVKGDEVSPFDLERKLRARYTLLGVHNIVLFAIAGIDMAAFFARRPLKAGCHKEEGPERFRTGPSRFQDVRST